MYAFIAVAYIFCFPLVNFFLNLAPLSFRNILLLLRSSIQLTLIVYSLYLVRQLIGLYQLRRLLKMPAGNLDFLGSGLLEMGLIIVVPFLFLKKSISKSWIVGLATWFLLLHALKSKDWIFVLDGWTIVNDLLFYISLVSTIYALLWLLKTRPAN